MPIRAENAARYPADWPDISRATKERAGWRCECDGRCGRPSAHLDEDGRCRNRHGEPRWQGRPGQRGVVLTTAHLDHVPEHCDPSNLSAMCEGCHLHYDRAHHAETRRATREAELGLIDMFAATRAR